MASTSSDEQVDAHRASRRSRAPDRGFRVQSRDVDVLMALAKMRLLRTSDLTRLFFDAKGTCQKRMRKLFDEGLVRAIVTEVSDENRYALTPMGHTFLAEAIDDDVPRWRPAPKVKGRELTHLDLLNGYRIALALGAAKTGGSIVRFTPEWDLRSQTPQADLIPDAAVVLDLPGGRRVEVALEIDAGTIAPSLVAKRVAKYEARRMMRTPVFGLAAPVVFLVAVTSRRARSLARALRGSTGTGVVLLGTAPYVLDDGGLSLGVCASIAVLADRKGMLAATDFAAGLVQKVGTRRAVTSGTRATARSR